MIVGQYLTKLTLICCTPVSSQIISFHEEEVISTQGNSTLGKAWKHTQNGNRRHAQAWGRVPPSIYSPSWMSLQRTIPSALLSLTRPLYRCLMSDSTSWLPCSSPNPKYKLYIHCNVGSANCWYRRFGTRSLQGGRIREQFLESHQRSWWHLPYAQSLR